MALQKVPHRGRLINPFPPKYILEEVESFAEEHGLKFDQALAVFSLAEQRTNQAHWVFDLDCQDERAVAFDERLGLINDQLTRVGNLLEEVAELAVRQNHPDE